MMQLMVYLAEMCGELQKEMMTIERNCLFIYFIRIGLLG